jgi:hypothetical protein
MDGITNIVRDFNDSPNIVRILSTDTMATIAATNYILNQQANIQAVNNGNFQWLSTDVILVSGSDGWNWFTISADHNSLVALALSGAPLISSDTTSSATPGTIRAVVGKMTGTAATMTSGNLVGVRGEVDVVGASGGFLYGTQGKIIPSDTLSGSVWAAPLFGQFDLTNATINAGQTAPVWADYGANGGTFTNVTGMRMFAGTNTIATLTLNAMDYRYGKASNLFELDGNAGTYILAASTGALSGTIKKIALVIDGVQYYMPVATIVG